MGSLNDEDAVFFVHIDYANVGEAVRIEAGCNLFDGSAHIAGAGLLKNKVASLRLEVAIACLPQG
jgi:hypothetical protein